MAQLADPIRLFGAGIGESFGREPVLFSRHREWRVPSRLTGFSSNTTSLTFHTMLRCHLSIAIGEVAQGICHVYGVRW